MARPFSKAQHAILLALHNGDRLHSAGGFTFLRSTPLQGIQTPTAMALLREGLIEVDVHPYYQISEAGRQKLQALQGAA